ncbi:DEAD/DEAH box helicase [Ignicoccus hospitalis]|uniref:DEAD/DEAH box helicase n=1 Tax=Ignicoccus hospitalis TaxID=160233 RepID=UPI001650A1BF|nr:DEAD/DEAH box helicase [Ignicoccus hospitalis]HIH90558.1 DEAD/DEAH box helicase [Desulfurococcaceae archaeon]
MEERGIRRLFPVQELALQKGLTEFKNLLVSAPTGSGKTLVAEMAIKNALDNGYKAVYLTPLRSLAFEKYASLKKIFKDSKVALSVGDYHAPEVGEADVLVATYERMDSLLRHNSPWLKEVGTVVVDEVHYVGDEERGPTLEVVVTRLKLMGKQIVALSATVGNPEDLASWLDAELVTHDWRPVKLEEGVMDPSSYEVLFEDRVEEVKEVLSDPGLDAALHYMREGQALYFASTRKRAENAAKKISKLLKPDKVTKEWAERVRIEVEGELGEVLAKMVERGAAFHHAGLTNEARLLVEEAFRSGAIKFVAATPTLAAGVNLPARAVVIERYTRYTDEGEAPISVSEYKQMAGRAGRPGLDVKGTSVLVARPKAPPEEVYERYVLGQPEDVRSALTSARALRRSLLGLIASKAVNSEAELVEFIEETLFGVTEGAANAIDDARRSLEFLKGAGLVEGVKATPLGTVVAKQYVDPLGAKVVLGALKRRKGKTTALGYLHLVAVTPDMPKRGLRSSEVRELWRVAEERFDELLIRDDEYVSESTALSALKVALALESWVKEEPEEVIAKKYGFYPGDLRVLSDTAAWLVHAYSEIAKFVGLYKHSEALAELELRLKYGVSEELVELVQIPYIGRVRARALWNAGIRSKEDFVKRADLAARVVGKGVVKRALEAMGLGYGLVKWVKP